MAHSSLSSKYQVVIPKEIRKLVPLKPGQGFIVIADHGVIHLIPEVPLKKLRGIFKDRGLSLEGVRDKSDRSF